MTKRGKGGGYLVGYGRPPKRTQFKKGQSGNPRGRKKGTKSPTSIIRTLLDRKVEVRDRGRLRKVPLMEAILLGSAHLALKGDIKNIALFVKMANDASDALAGEVSVVSEQEDLTLLKAFRDRILTEKGGDDDDDT